MVQKLINAFWYAGVDQHSFELVTPKIRKSNRTMIIAMSAFVSVLIFAMLVMSIKNPIAAKNRVFYESGFILSISVLILSATLLRKFEKLITPLVNVSYAIFYLYGIIMGTIMDPEGKTVTFMVTLVFVPALFINRPLHVIITTAFYTTIFIVLCLMNKAGTTLTIDIVDAVMFSILGIASSSVINHMKVRGYVSEQRLHEIGRLDQLTQMNNQNAYQLELHTIYEKFKNSLACIYIDANGLHSLNNNEGHEEGDKMLQCIARELVNHFGSELTYRIGGDEFLAFIPDMNRESLVKKIASLTEAISKNQYSIALGYEVVNTHHFEVKELVKAAELRMGEEKRIYHREHDR